ncbi:MAG: VWA domain-containing protein [Acidobacteriota bacterium]|nr:VWA domain-containing protein [Acidobacteriota bacterium]
MRNALLFALLASATVASAQQPYTEHVEVSLHNLDVVVTDRSGRPVPGLAAADFVVTENGAVQEITNFSVYTSGADASTELAAGTAQVNAEPAPPRRFIFFIDEMSMQAAARNAVKRRASELVRAMRPGDIAAVVRPTGAAKIVQEFTGDAAVVERSLNKAIDECKVRLTAPSFAELRALRRALETARTPTEISVAKREYAQNARDRVAQRLNQIRAVIASMRDKEGKKVLVLVTSGLSEQPGREAFSIEEDLALVEASGDDAAVADDGASGLAGLRAAAAREAAAQKSRWRGSEKFEVADFRGQIEDLARSAAADGVTIYALEPELPLMLDAIKGADSENTGSILGGGAASGKEVIPNDMLTRLLQNEAQTLTTLSEKTGGRWFRGDAGIENVFRTIAADLDTYYSLAYRARGDAKKARRVKVTIRNRPELLVRTRTDVLEKTAGRSMGEQVIAALLHPHELDDLAMQAKAEKPHRDGRVYAVPIEVVIPVEKISFMRGDDGQYRALVCVHYAASRDEKELLSYGAQDQLIELTPQQYAELRRIRYRYTSTIKVPKGTIRIALGAVDTSSRLASLQTLSVVAR